MIPEKGCPEHENQVDTMMHGTITSSTAELPFWATYMKSTFLGSPALQGRGNFATDS